MKKYNQSIQIIVELDSIAQQLLQSFHPEHPHRELLVDTIIGNMRQDTRQITQLYNSLNGFTNDIDFEAGDKVEVASKDLSFGYWVNDLWKNSETRPLSLICEVVEVNPYKDDKLLVKYYYPKRNATPDENGNFQQTDYDSHELWINHQNVTGKIAVSKEYSNMMAIV